MIHKEGKDIEYMGERLREQRSFNIRRQVSLFNVYPSFQFTILLRSLC